MRDFEWLSARGLPEASALLGKLARAGVAAAVKAGGVDLLDQMKEGTFQPEAIVDIRPLDGLRTIEDDEGAGLSLGCLATLSDIAVHPAVRSRYRLLAQAAADAATPQLRNVATLGGNLCQRPRCWYFRSIDFPCLKKGGSTCYAEAGDNRYLAVFATTPCPIVAPSSMAVALAALDALIVAITADGERQIPIGDFYVLPEQDIARETVLAEDELVARVRVPPPIPGLATGYVKIREKETFDWPLAEAAVAIVTRPDGVVTQSRIVLGAAAPVPWRARDAERRIVGRALTREVAADAARAALAGAKPLSGNGYKVALIEECVRRALLQTVS